MTACFRSMFMAAALAMTLAGCATTASAPPGTVVADAKIAQVQPGVTTRAQLLAQLGPTTSIRFDSGVEVWRYLLPPSSPSAAGAPAAYGEYVVVLDPRGVVAKVRSSPVVYQIPGQK